MTGRAISGSREFSWKTLYEKIVRCDIVGICTGRLNHVEFNENRSQAGFGLKIKNGYRFGYEIPAPQKMYLFPPKTPLSVGQSATGSFFTVIFGLAKPIPGMNGLSILERIHG